MSDKEKIAYLEAIIRRMDEVCPVADRTCDEPGITLSEAVKREMAYAASAEQEKEEGDE